MKTQIPINNILLKLIILIICTAGLSTTAQNTIPAFNLLSSCAVSKSTGYHDGSGWVDIDNDGDLDLIITNSSGDNKPNLLYRNERAELFTLIENIEYTEQTVKMGLAGPFGDLDNDGDEDIILSDWLGYSYHTFMNDGYGNFIKRATLSKKDWALASLLDMNSDGYLDLIDIHSISGKIYLNDGQGNYDEFEPIKVVPPHSTSYLISISFSDADNDGDMDLYSGYWFSEGHTATEKNLFFLNNGTGQFDQTKDTLIFLSETAMTMGANWVDYDNDGDMDLYVLESSVYGPATDHTGVLYENKGGLVFEEHVIEPKEYCNTHKTSPIWGDLDNDGDQDLLISVEKNEFYGHTTSLKHNILFQNNGDGSFTEIKEGSLVQESSHTATMEDFDNDGDLDVLMVGFSFEKNGTNYLYENEGNDNNWLELTCIGTQSSKTPYGARIHVIANINGKRTIQTREISSTTGHNTVYPSSRLHFGLGDAEMVDSLIIRWSMGQVDVLTNVKANQFYRAIEDSALEIDFKASNYIRQDPGLIDTAIYEGESLSFNLADHYQLVTGDTVPESVEETLLFSLYNNENTDAVNASVEENVLTLIPGTTGGISTVQVIISAGFTERVDGFRVEYKVPSAISNELAPQLRIYPNPVKDILNIDYSAREVNTINLEILDISGKVVYEDSYASDILTQTLNLEKLDAGIYIIRIGNEEYNYAQKVIKQ